ncbi:homeobox-leucine zipper protein PROTODERMAL FACTOR 2-like [Olea europaea var. sylvestris]|uniref:homeobox-leucine zipper protein PROTODERMAL FACTOR 2-like n=1 Tax=Olea europaea var. sylvestris TaxID=158386 RepID=UPI000C1D604B|nr:homeobox-leucine zipper protein PROTODERMAL FACTOR 2-like [Olea europaea var. sylvestris]
MIWKLYRDTIDNIIYTNVLLMLVVYTQVLNITNRIQPIGSQPFLETHADDWTEEKVDAIINTVMTIILQKLFTINYEFNINKLECTFTEVPKMLKTIQPNIKVNSGQTIDSSNGTKRKSKEALEKHPRWLRWSKNSHVYLKKLNHDTLEGFRIQARREDNGSKIKLEGVQESIDIVDQVDESKFDLTLVEGHILDQEELLRTSCAAFDEQHLRIENARLREEIDRISGIAAKYVGKPLLSYAHLPPGSSRSLDLGPGNYGLQTGMDNELFGAADLLRSVSGPADANKPMVIELAVAAMEELIRMAQTGEPLWMPSTDNSAETLSEEEYVRTFPRLIGPKPLGLKSEASRESAIVIMNHISLIEILMDVNQWTSVFSSIVSRAMIVEVLSTGVAGNYNGALQVMTAEFQVPSPLVPTRENYFARYCKQHGDGTWAVVDVSLDNLRATSIPRCRRRPSGCLIQELPNGYSKVIWVEHIEVDDRAVHTIYKPLVNSGLAFGARRWVATLDRQCERLASVMANNISGGDGGVISCPEGRKSMLKLAERMVMSFCSGVGASTAHTWTTLSGSGADDVRVMTRKSVDDPGRPPGIVLSAATSFWLPVPPKRVFDFLRDENLRNEWDILSNEGLVQEMAHIANGRDPGNSVSLLRVNSANSSQSNMLILQESCTDSTGSYVIYAPVDIIAMNVVLSGGDPDYVALLPSGFAILPDGPINPAGGINPEVGSGGSLLTVAFQILVDSVPTAKLSLGSVATVNSLIKCTVERIKGALLCEGA